MHAFMHLEFSLNKLLLHIKKKKKKKKKKKEKKKKIFSRRSGESKLSEPTNERFSN